MIQQPAFCITASQNNAAFPRPGKMPEVKLRRVKLSHLLEYQRQYFPYSGKQVLGRTDMYKKTMGYISGTLSAFR